LRDALVDALAVRMVQEVPTDEKARRTFVEEEKQAVERDEVLMDQSLTAVYAGLRIPGRLQAMLRGQVRKERAAMAAEKAHPSARAHEGLVKATERFVLVLDAAIRGLGRRDTREAARQLAEVADDLAFGASQLTRRAEVGRGPVRMAAATT